MAAVVRSPEAAVIASSLPLTSPVSEVILELYKKLSDNCLLQGVISNYVPAQQQKHLQFLDFNSAGDLVLGCSSLNTRYWTGSLWYYRAGASPAEVTNPEKCLTGVDLETGVVDGRFVRPDQVVVGLDSGVSMVTLSREEDGDRVTHHLEQHSPAMEHDDILTGLDTWARDCTLATAGADSRLCVYNSALALVHSYHPAHAGHVSGVACCQESSHVLASCSRGVDSSVRVWDTRQPRPASTVAALPDSPPSCVAWAGDSRLVVGGLGGQLRLLDTRRPGPSLASLAVMDRPVRVLRLAPGGDKLAVAGDDAVVTVVRLAGDTAEVARVAAEHGDMVRGLAWSGPDTLWSAAWDQTVAKYDL